MIYYVTVHWNSDRWIDIQLEMIRKYTQVPFKVYAFLNGVDPVHHDKFDHVFVEGDPRHEVKLDIMARSVMDGASDDDWMIFLDGDAFPVSAVYHNLAPLMEQHKLVAVQRVENLGEGQPHPCFCATTVGLWKEIKGTWAKGYKWINAMGNPETDVGGELLGLLVKYQVPWLPLHRTNIVNLNPVFFGIYGNIVYHHGAGFRGGGCRIIWYERGLYNVYRRLDARILNNITPARWLRKVRNSRWHPEGRMKHRIASEIAPLEQEVYEAIRSDPEYVQTFIRGLPQK